MESVDMKKLETAIIYLQRIADGNNPINNLPADEDAVLNNPNVIRCMYFVKEILEEVKRNKGCIGKKGRSAKLDFPLEVLKVFSYKEDKAISLLVEQINLPVDESLYQKLSYSTVTKWLKKYGFLMEEYNEQFQKNITLPTEKGVLLGIRGEKRTNRQGKDYIRVLYNKQAQEYIVKNMEAILGEK